MTAGLGSQPITATRIGRPRVAVVGLMAATLALGGALGVVAKSEFDTLTGSGAAAAVPASSTLSKLLGDRARITVDRGPLVEDAGPAGSRPAIGATPDGAGSAEAPLPGMSSHRIEHGPLP